MGMVEALGEGREATAMVGAREGVRVAAMVVAAAMVATAASAATAGGQEDLRASGTWCHGSGR